MENVESEFLKRHNLKIEEARSSESVKKSERGRILRFPKRSIWNTEKMRKLYEMLFFQ
ncbi:hypothetical protein DQM68_03605 [Leptospira mayottensis]|uniref:Uncharacterized protein n=2 Tax=Leptospira mayottensis TaxID=1137606 RepID=A0AA87MPR6_9LEPT|nr:hypothetical protein DQM68_03605 [Leptospira mayottensis]AZQ00749.1 hypothetical protein LEP1GSC190_00355 [Leptospira mayottensis 200901116]EKR99641.1 hypothetical protein LEP1GSC125_3218 [Leptospira mayottensis 200901122]AXR63825.1 hypothetical protein DQM28_05860 [Leptospira mayottensis]AXR67474.1 hypothetical protein DPV73_05105 [Leptospira mayottensis]